jgi:hypothetical protein
VLPSHWDERVVNFSADRKQYSMMHHLNTFDFLTLHLSQARPIRIRAFELSEEPGFDVPDLLDECLSLRLGILS